MPLRVLSYNVGMNSRNRFSEITAAIHEQKPDLAALLDVEDMSLAGEFGRELGMEARRVLHGTMEAFARRDVNAARNIWEEDDVVDVRYHLVRHDLMAMLAGARAIPALQNDALILQRATYLLWIAHKLERVADHSGNICERIVFILEGETSIKRSLE